MTRKVHGQNGDPEAWVESAELARTLRAEYENLNSMYLAVVAANSAHAKEIRAVKAENERLRTSLTVARESLYAAHDAIHEATREIDLTLDPDCDSDGSPPDERKP